MKRSVYAYIYIYTYVNNIYVRIYIYTDDLQVPGHMPGKKEASTRLNSIFSSFSKRFRRSPAGTLGRPSVSSAAPGQWLLHGIHVAGCLHGWSFEGSSMTPLKSVGVDVRQV